jgi:hypothetical protein
MKKLLGIVVLGLLLASCSENQKDKATTAIENCANDLFLKARVGPRIDSNEDLQNIFFQDKKFLGLYSQSGKDKVAENKAKSKLYNFIENNFKYPKTVKDKMYDLAIGNALMNKKKMIRHSILKMDPESLDPDLSKSANSELRNKLSDYTSKFEEQMNISHKSSIKIWDYKMSKFIETDLSLKLFEKSFERKFIRCESLRKRSQIAFDEKWK